MFRIKAKQSPSKIGNMTLSKAEIGVDTYERFASVSTVKHTVPVIKNVRLGALCLMLSPLYLYNSKYIYKHYCAFMRKISLKK